MRIKQLIPVTPDHAVLATRKSDFADTCYDQQDSGHSFFWAVMDEGYKDSMRQQALPHLHCNCIRRCSTVFLGQGAKRAGHTPGSFVLSDFPQTSQTLPRRIIFQLLCFRVAIKMPLSTVASSTAFGAIRSGSASVFTA